MPEGVWRVGAGQIRGHARGWNGDESVHGRGWGALLQFAWGKAGGGEAGCTKRGCSILIFYYGADFQAAWKVSVPLALSGRPGLIVRGRSVLVAAPRTHLLFPAMSSCAWIADVTTSMSLYFFYLFSIKCYWTTHLYSDARAHLPTNEAVPVIHHFPLILLSRSLVGAS